EQLERGFDAVESHGSSCEAGLRRDHAEGRMVGSAPRRGSGVLPLHRVLDLGGAPGRQLPLRQSPLAVLLAGALLSGGEPVGACALRTAARMVAGVPAVLARH